jgi:hypothetical protein
MGYIASDVPRPMPTLDVAGPTGIERRAPGWRVADAVLLVVPLVVTFVIYRPILRNYFYADDFILFYDLANEGPLGFALTPYGGHLQLARNVVFLVSARVFGTDPVPFYWTALLTHLANVALLFHVVRVLTESPRLASAGALLWGASPLNEGSLGWYSIYGQVMAATVLLVLLALWGRAVADGRSPSAHTVALSFVLAIVGSTCFGVGLGIAFVLPIVFVILFPGASLRAKLGLASLWVVIPAFYVAMHVLHGLVSTRPVPGASPLAALHAARGVAELLAHLLAHGIGGLFLGFSAVPAQHPLLVWTLAAGFALLVGAAFVRPRAAEPRRARRVLLAVTVLLLAGYGAIAAARAPMQSLFRAPNVGALGTIARYHYVGPLCIALLACVAARTLSSGPGAPRVRDAGVAVLGVLVLGAWLASGRRIDHHDGVRAETTRVLETIATAAAATPAGETVYVPNRRFNGVGPLFAQIPALFPRTAGVFMVFYPTRTIDGRAVRFVEEDPSALVKLTADPRRPIAALVVAPDQVPSR